MTQDAWADDVPGGAARPCAHGPIRATFLQPLDKLRGRPAGQWLADFNEMRELGIKEVCLQWMQLDGISFADLPGAGLDANTFLGPVSEAASTAGMKLRFGLAADLRLVDVFQSDAAILAEHLAGMRAASIPLAEAILKAARASGIFSGWYLPEEIDDASLADASRRAVWLAHLKAMSDSLPPHGGSVQASLYITGGLGPQDAGQFCASAWADAGVAVLLQDGFGARNLADPQQISGYMAAIDAAVRAVDGQWGIVIELFEQLAGSPINDQPFRSATAPMDRVERQIDLANRFPAAIRTSYAVSENMLASAGRKARSLAKAYKSLYCGAG